MRRGGEDALRQELVSVCADAQRCMQNWSLHQDELLIGASDLL